VEGKMSEDALFWLLTNMRLSSANWHEEILPSLPEAGLLREMASMMAVNLELERRQKNHLENIETLLSLLAQSQLEKNSGQGLKVLYQKVSGDLELNPSNNP
jgi:hypothetical protein